MDQKYFRMLNLFSGRKKKEAFSKLKYDLFCYTKVREDNHGTEVYLKAVLKCLGCFHRTSKHSVVPENMKIKA